MRALFNQPRTYTAPATSVFDLCEVQLKEMDDTDNIRDVYVRALQRPNDQSETDMYLYLVKTRAEADAITDKLADGAAITSAGVIAYIEDQALSGSRQTLTLTNNADVDPDFTGVKVIVNGAGDSSDWDTTHGYVASMSEAISDEIEYTLGLYMGDGQALDGFHKASIVKGPEDLLVLSKAKKIVGAIADEEEAERVAGYFALRVNFTVVVGDAGIYNRGETNYQNVLKFSGAIRSILGDERITLNGLCDEVVISDVVGPEPVMGDNEAYVAAKINGFARVPLMFSDR